MIFVLKIFHLTRIMKSIMLPIALISTFIAIVYKSNAQPDTRGRPLPFGTIVF